VQRLGDEVPIDTFVSAREEARGEDRIASRVLAASDGAALVVGGYDRPRGAPVDAGKGRWLPSRAAFVGAGNERFSDAACTIGVATKIAHNALCPLSAAFVFADACGNGAWHALGARAAPPFRHDENGACVLATDGAVLGFAVGAEIPIESFAVVTTVDVGRGVAKRRGYGAGGAPVAWREVVDATTNEPCSVAKAADGELRCVPAAAELVAYYTDAACTQPGFAHATTGCDDALPHFVHDLATARAFEVGPAAKQLFESKNGTCRAFTPVVASSIFSATEAAPDRFPLAEERSD
jgi:hypothetical protein